MLILGKLYVLNINIVNFIIYSCDFMEKTILQNDLKNLM